MTSSISLIGDTASLHPRLFVRSMSHDLPPPDEDSMGDDPSLPDDDTMDLWANPPSELGGVTDFLGFGAADPCNDLFVGETLGDVTVVRLIEEGGMGRVYEAVQSKPQRHVAVKVMRPGVVSSALLKRFDYEAEILGRLTHPGIAHIYTVGTQEIGGAMVPYFVMEFIPNAKSLTDYAKAHELSIHDRMKLFRAVCDAVAHGHHKGIIHRDLKPSNVLVNANGQPKVIDFGIARSTDADVAMATMHADAGKMIGTLQYMCPEQFNADANDIDVRADIYALGVVLWQLITGEVPYDIGRKSVFEAARIVKESDPIWPAKYRHSRYRDIKVIALKCLEKDRDRRYSHASDLVDEIDRYLRGDAILASPPTLLDTLGRLARKHRVVATAVAAVFAAMLLAIVGVTGFYVQADRERVWAGKQRRKAQIKEAEAIEQRLASEKVQRFLVKTFQMPTTQTAGRDVTVRELLSMACVQLDTEYGKATTPNDIATKANIRTAIGKAFLGLGNPFDARDCFADSLTLLESQNFGDASDKALCMNELGLALHACGDYVTAREMLASALSMKERLLGVNHLETMVGRSNLAIVLTALGEYEDSARLLDNAQQLCMRLLGPSHASCATVIGNLGELRYRQGRYAEAEALVQEAGKIRLKAYGDDHAANVMIFNTLGDICRCTGRYDQAAVFHLQARRLDELLLSKDNPNKATTLSKLGELYRVQGKLDAAKPLLEEALAIREKAGLGDHAETAVVLHRLALLYAAQTNREKAELMFQRTISVRDTRLPPSHPDSVRAVYDCVQFYRDNGDSETADAYDARLIHITKTEPE